MWGIEKMRPYLEGYKFTVITDHFSLRWLRSLDNPTGRLARWAVALQQHDFTVEYRKGALNHVPDALSREPLVEGEEEETNTDGQDLAAILPCKWHQRILQAVQEDPRRYPDYRVQGDRLYRHFHERHSTDEDTEASAWKLCLPLPLREEALRECHDATTAGHLGITKTLARLAQRYYWPGMFQQAANYETRHDRESI